MNSTILSIYEQYKELFYDVNFPEINIKYTRNTDYKAQFLTKELYEEKYILYIDTSKKWNQNDLDKILFHEFTHLYDSLKISETNYEDFTDYLINYSEIHASFVCTQRLVNCFDDKQITYKYMITFNDRKLSLYDYIDNHFDLVKSIFSVSPRSVLPERFTDGILYLQYFLGEVLFSSIYVSDYKTSDFIINGIFDSIIKDIEDSYFICPKGITTHINRIIKKYTDIRSKRFIL